MILFTAVGSLGHCQFHSKAFFDLGTDVCGASRSHGPGIGQQDIEITDIVRGQNAFACSSRDIQ